jgi:hypothetical protein
MTVKLSILRRGYGHQTIPDLSLEQARKEVELAARQGYIATANNRQITASELQDGQEVKLFPTGQGG